MSGERRTTRRRFLVLGGLSAAALAGVGAARLLDGEARRRPLRVVVGEALQGDGIRAVGEAYVRERPGERGTAALVRMLRRRAAWREALDSPDVPGVVAAEARADFRAGRTVNLEGWCLSETEARACALSAVS